MMNINLLMKINPNIGKEMQNTVNKLTKGERIGENNNNDINDNNNNNDN